MITKLFISIVFQYYNNILEETCKKFLILLIFIVLSLNACLQYKVKYIYKKISIYFGILLYI